MDPRTLATIVLLCACSKDPLPVVEPDDTDADTDVPWSPPQGGPFQFETETEWAPGDHWLVDAHYFPASKRGRPAVLFVSGRASGSMPEQCGITDWPEGMVEPFVARDWTVLVTDRVGCRDSHQLRWDVQELQRRHRPEQLMAQLTRKLRDDGYGPLTVMGLSGGYWVTGVGPDVPQMKAAVQLNTSNLGDSGIALTASLPFKWLILAPEADENALKEYRSFQGFWEDGPYPEWTIWYGQPVAAGSFERLHEGDPNLWEAMAGWLEPHLEGAYQAGPDAWETP